MAGRQLSIESCTASTEVSPTHTAQKAINGDGLTCWDSGPLVKGSAVLLPLTITLKLKVSTPRALLFSSLEYDPSESFSECCNNQMPAVISL